MDYRRLGRTDLRVSAIMLGTMTFGEQNSEAEGHAQLDHALDRGVNFIDTAEMYSIPPRAETQGSTERIIGSWLAARKNRDKVILATKVSGRSQSPYMRPDGEATRLDRANIHYAIDQSLKRLQTDYVDLYQLHWPDRPLPLFGAGGTIYKAPPPLPEIPIEETLEALGELVAAGKVRHVALSNETSWGVARFLSASERGAGPRIVSIQNAYNLLNRTFEIGLAETAMREDVGLLAYSPLAQGYLTGKYQNGARPPGARTTLFERGQRYEKPGVAQAIDAYLALAKEVGVSPAKLSLAFVTSRPFVTSNIIGATTMTQLEEDLASLDVTITPQIEARIDEIHQLHSNPAP
ncbi:MULTISPECIES: NADP(H)-dependent aldo-keto reductase [Methylosinus]|uniref:Protein tas n=1 Tax=Methylosinus trichosporium (strain ATCC 35070 / NCIMB 11131 / UNIQEM 75 / OB3b) TaxID=595536 RepID=A0A2D2D0S8_METT3|nr:MULTISPECIES: NADP(H)-dependent aldo-keto reductase [Methylosinus]ATQ68597.1 NADP(H)-dependent aldo-keto reductase [Methylosinus trichosporium OB3b]OBS51017.1 aldo/keto reductase [Methylosinus sp. 3S-1]